MTHQKFMLISLISFLLISVFFSCEDRAEDYSTSPDDILSFSQDTLRFDTVLATVNTPKKQFMIYNQNKKPLLITSIRLAKGENSEFKVNVDGMAGTHFEQTEIGANDSLFVWVDVKPAESGQTAPVLKSDEVIFVTNGVQQKVTLEAYSQDVYIWKGRIIESSLTLPNDKPYLIYDSLEIKENVTLTLPEGTLFYMHAPAKIIVRGSIRAQGTFENRVIIRGDRVDEVINIPYDRIPGQWDGIYFAASSYGNEMDYVYIRNGTSGLQFETSDPGTSKLKIRNSIVSNMKGPLMAAVNCHIEGENCEFSNSKGTLMYLAGGSYRFTHCTLANCYESSELLGNSENRTVVLTNIFYEKEQAKAMPLVQADFINSIVWGIKSGSKIDLARDTVQYPATDFNFKFQNCLIPNDSLKNERFVNCIYGKNPLFRATGSEDGRTLDLIYDFRLDSISPARNVADPVISAGIPLDMNRISRFSDEGPDMGAYEWAPQETEKIKRMF